MGGIAKDADDDDKNGGFDDAKDGNDEEADICRLNDSFGDTDGEEVILDADADANLTFSSSSDPKDD